MIAESGLLEDIHVTSDPRINALILSAPTKTMDLLLALIRDLDLPPPHRAIIKVIHLRRADAAFTAATIQQLFLGTGGTTGAAAAGGLPGAFGGPAGGAVPVTTAPTLGAPAIPRAPFTLGGVTPEGAPLIPLTVSVDVRSNSVIVAGSPNDLEIIEILTSRLDDAEVTTRRFEVIHLRNASAPDVANALQGFLNESLLVLSKAGQLTQYAELVRDVVVVPEPFTNKLLVSATAQYYNDIMRLIEELDTQQPQVVIQVLIAEVDLNASEEFGVEIGLQSPVLFSRSVIPATNFLGTNGIINYTTPTTGTGIVPLGVTVNNSINPAALPGFNFNNTGPLGNNPVVNPGLVGFQGLGNLGVGRTSPTANVGGFVFSAASDAFNLLIRALKVQGRVDVLSRPQIMALDNQTAKLSVGQNVPIITSSNVTATGVISNNFDRLNVGVNLTVTPRINPDGTVLMRVTPEVSSIISTMVPLGNGIFGTSYNDQIVDTTVLAGDGETVAIGGLIQKSDHKNENKIPWFGDLPYLGSLFRYRTQAKTKTELMIILTPHIVRSRADADRILAEESRRMDWVLNDVVKTHGTSGLAPILPPPPALQEPPVLSMPAVPGEPVPVKPVPAGPVPSTPLPEVEILPEPRTLPKQSGPAPQAQSQVPQTQSPIPVHGAPTAIIIDPDKKGSTSSAAAPVTPTDQAVDPLTPAEPKKEKRGIWKFFQRGQ